MNYTHRPRTLPPEAAQGARAILDDRCVFLTSGQHSRGYCLPGHRQEGGDTEDRRVLAWWLTAWPCLLALGHSRREHRQPVFDAIRPNACDRRCPGLACGAGIRCACPLEPGAPRGRMAQRRTTRGQPRCRQSRAPDDPHLGGGAQCSLIVATSDASAAPAALRYSVP